MHGMLPRAQFVVIGEDDGFARLGISPKTVETHQGNLKRKLRAPSFEKLLPIAVAYAAALKGTR